MKSFTPWILVIAAALAFVTKSQVAPDSKTEGAEKAVPKAEATTAQMSALPCKSPGGPVAALCEPLRVIRDFFGLQPEPDDKKSSTEIFREIETAAWTTRYRLRFFVALVPDPIDSYPPLSFDLALDAIQKGFGSAAYKPDRVWLPWALEAGKAAKAANPLYREAPGVLLFRCGEELAVVLLVGESPKTGIQKRSFAVALQLATGLQASTRDREIGILGPSFSGSVDSLLVAMNQWKSQGPQPLSFRMASGSATADDLDSKLSEFKFCRTIVPDTQLRTTAFDFLRDQMGWELNRIALITEADTAYGQNNQDGKSVQIGFPSRISDIRNAWEHGAQANAETGSRVKVGNGGFVAGRPALNLDLEDRDYVVDQVPSLSYLTTPAKDLELSNLLQTVSREGIRYAGVLATDLKDKIFLIRKIRQYAPDTVAFTFDSNLLLAHPQYSEDMDGVVVISSAPLFTEGASWLPGSTLTRVDANDEHRSRHQFISENQQGLFVAVRHLLGKDDPSMPRVWISVVGNGSLWPLAHLQVDGLHGVCQQNKNEKKLSGSYAWLAGRANLELLIFGALLGMASYSLRKKGLLKGSGTSQDEVRLSFVNRKLTFLGGGLLLVLAAVLLVIVGLPAWAPFLKLAKGDIWISPIWTWRRLLFFGTFASVYMYLAYDLARVVQTGRTKGGHQLWLLGGVSALLPAIFVWLLVVLWMPGREIELFQLRTRVFGSGLSPLIPLSLVTGALFVWILCEVQRLGLVQRQGPDRPLDLLCETSVKSCGDFVQRLHAWMDQTFPRKRWIWVLLPGVLVPPLVLLWGTVQPISETKAYGRIFLVLLVVAWFLVLMSFLRFFSIWLSLRSILQRLNYVSPDLKKAFEKLSGEIEWNPMRSFAFNLPRFKMLDLSVRRFKSLVSARRIEDSLPGVEARLEKIFQSEAEGFTLDEARHRRELDETFHDACKSLAQQVQTPDVREFVALRIVVYLRYVFGHLRSSLMGAVGSGLLVLLAVAAFVFQPKQFVSLAIWVTLAVSVMVTFWVFLQMDRNPTLSRIGGTKPGEVTFDKAFWANFTLYVIVPVLSMIATQSPEVGRLLGRMADQFLRVAGSG